MSSKSIKPKKIKQTYPDKLYQILFERHIKEWYYGCDKVILHHASTQLDGKIIASCEI
jgi:DNA polymerase III psi subunit